MPRRGSHKLSTELRCVRDVQLAWEVVRCWTGIGVSAHCFCLGSNLQLSALHLRIPLLAFGPKQSQALSELLRDNYCFLCFPFRVCTEFLNSQHYKKICKYLFYSLHTSAGRRRAGSTWTAQKPACRITFGTNLNQQS